MKKQNEKKALTIRELTVFAMFGAIIYASKVAMQGLPNIHLVGVFIVALTVIYRIKALFPIYIYILLDGLFGGFNLWWIPYLYIWTVLWGAVMLLPKNMPTKWQIPVYMAVCSLHGFMFGILYAPAEAILFGLNFNGTVSWVIAGLPYDAIHGISNLVLGTMIVPLINIIKRAEKAVAK